jgi:hypothetical protein
MLFAILLAHWDSVLGTSTNVMLVRLTYILLPDGQKGHVRRGARVVASVRVTVSRSERRFVRVYRVERQVVRDVEHEIGHEVDRVEDHHREAHVERPLEVE